MQEIGNTLAGSLYMLYVYPLLTLLNPNPLRRLCFDLGNAGAFKILPLEPLMRNNFRWHFSASRKIRAR
jgi:hypothetical protein